LIILAVLATDSGGAALQSGWVWLVVPAAFAGIALPPRHRTVIFAACAGFVAAVSTQESVSLGLATAGFVFLSITEDPGRRPWYGWAGGLIGAVVALGLSLISGRGVYEQPIVFVAAGYLAAILWRSWLRARALGREAAELRGHAAWLEQRTHLARELHDVVGHHVTAMVVQAEAGQLGDDPAAALRAVADVGRIALGELDTLVVHLREPNPTIAVSAPPRLSDIDELLAEPLRQRGMTVRVHLDADPGLDELGTLTAYRIAQEAITNIARHAHASTAWIELVRADDHARLRVSDDGVGPTRSLRQGAGLIGIGERVRGCGGRWEFGERTGGGTVLQVDLPAATP
jgi:signal transduction histidine kinase